MYKHILIPTDGSDLSKKAITHAVELAKFHGAEITAVVITNPYHAAAYGEFVYETADEPAAEWLAAATEAAKAAGVPCSGTVTPNEHPWEGIIKTGKERGCDLIVMASHGRRGMAAIVLGSETVKVLTHCDIPVLVCR